MSKMSSTAQRERTYSPMCYVFVSTNMVYKGRPEGFDVRNGTDGPWLKEYDVDVVEYAKYSPDSYGGRKVFCEAVIKKAYEITGFPYTAL
jgi:nucleoside-diphosphate-sugar epimerase